MYHNAEEIGTVIRGIVVLSACFAAWRFLIRPTHIEIFRQRIFGLRREAFEAMLSHRISEEEYRELAGTMNTLIRHPEKFTFLRFIGMGVGGNRKESTWVRPAVGEFRRRMIVELIKHMLRCSLPLMVITPVLGAVITCWRGAKGVIVDAARPVADQIREESISAA